MLQQPLAVAQSQPRLDLTASKVHLCPDATSTSCSGNNQVLHMQSIRWGCQRCQGKAPTCSLPGLPALLNTLLLPLLAVHLCFQFSRRECSDSPKLLLP